MNTLAKIFFFSLLMISMVAHLANAVTHQQGEEDYPFLEENDNEGGEVHQAGDDSSIQLRGVGRFLAQSRVVAATNCNVYHKICKAKGSPGQDCCSNKCVDKRSDRLNCGKCGHKCNFSEMCCKGVCVNPMTDRDNCGSCSNKCQHHDHKKSKCAFGICSYA